MNHYCRYFSVSLSFTMLQCGFIASHLFIRSGRN